MNYKYTLTVFLFGLITMTLRGQISNDVCGNAEIIPAAADQTCTPYQGSFANAVEEAPSDSCNGESSPAAFDQWFSFSAVSANHTIDAETPPSGGFQGTGAVVIVYDACNGNIIGCGNPNLLSFGGFTVVQSGLTRVNLNGLQIGNSYLIRVYNYGDALPPPDQDTFTLCVYTTPDAPSNDDCVNASVILANDTCQSISGTVNSATEADPAESCGGNDPSATAFDVWYKFRPIDGNQIIRVVPEDSEDPSLAPVIELWDTCGGQLLTCANPDIFPFIGAIPGTTELNALGLDTLSNYFVRLYHYGDEAPTDGNFEICVFNAPPPPENDSCQNASILIVGDSCVATEGTLASAGEELAPMTCDTTSESAFDVWYRFEAKDPLQIIEFNSESVAGVIELFDACNGSLLDCAEPLIIGGIGAIPGNTTLETNGLDSGTTYTFRVYHFGESTPTDPNFTVCVYNAPPPPNNDNCDSARVITQVPSRGDCNPISATTISASASGISSSCDTTVMDDDVWFSFTAIADRAVAFVGNKSFELFGSNMGFALYDACNGNEINCFSTTEADSAIFSGLQPGSDYWLRIFSDDTTSQGDFDLCVYAPPAGPANDLCSGAFIITASTDDTCIPTDGSFADALQESPSDSCGAYRSPNAFDTWYGFEALTTSHVVEVTTPPTGGFQGVGAVVEVYDACGGNILACGNPNIISVQGFEVVQSGTTQAIVENLTPTNIYYVRVYNYGDSLPEAGQDDFTICVKGPIVPVNNDSCEIATTLTVESSCVPTNGTFEGANEEKVALACGTDDPSTTAIDVWYNFTANTAEQTIEVGPVQPSANAVAPVIELYDNCSTQPIDCANPQIVGGFGAIPGTTVLEATGLTPGTNYLVRTHHYGDGNPSDPDFTICVYNSFTNITDLQATDLNIFPNPSEGELYISLKEPLENATIQIMNMDGKIHWEKNWNILQSTSVVLNPIANGVYIMKLSTDIGSIQKRIVINK